IKQTITRIEQKHIENEHSYINTSLQSSSSSSSSSSSIRQHHPITIPDSYDTEIVYNYTNSDKQKSNVPLYYDRSAGVLTAIRPCGIIIRWEEMFRAESTTHLILMLQKWYENMSYCKPTTIGYDRGCQIERVIRNL